MSVFERSFNRCMGLCTTDNGLWMSSLYQVWRFENLFSEGQAQDNFDRLYLPQVGYTTGDLDIHDIAVDADGKLVFVNTLFGCLATLSDTHSFKPLWQPPFLSKLAAYANPNRIVIRPKLLMIEKIAGLGYVRNCQSSGS